MLIAGDIESFDPERGPEAGPAAGVLGRAIRRLRVLRAIKQSDLAARAGVTQATVSRWERGTHSPTPDQAAQVLELLAARLDGTADRALRRLVESSPWKVHLVCDATHRLLAASPARTREWTRGAAEIMGRSLWRFATPQIQAAEAALAGIGWHDRLDKAVIAWTAGNGRSDYRILPGTMMWEPVVLSDGTRARLCTTLPLADLLAMAPDAVVVSRPPA
jgi:transcriptional regulator with XRE-family HTH domain